MRRSLTPFLLLLAAAGPSPSFTNGTFSGTIGVTGAATLSGGGALSGTFTGAHTYSGAVTLSGGGTFSGTFAGTPTWSGQNAFTSTIAQTGSRAWAAGAFPVAGNLGVYQSLTYTGTPTTGIAGPEGTTIPVNGIVINESMSGSTSAPGGIAALEIQHNTSNGSGGRYALFVAHQLSGTIAAGNNHYYAANFFDASQGNVTGAATGSGNGLGQFGVFGLSSNIGTVGNPVYAHEIQGFEWDFVPSSTSRAQYVSGMKLVNFAPAAYTTYATSAFLLMATANPATEGTFSNGILFGDPQAADANGFPISTTGTMIGSLTGTAGIGIDFSAATFSTALMKGPNGFQIDNSNRVHTNSIAATGTGTTVGVLSGYGTTMFSTHGAGTGAATNYIDLASAVSGGDPRVTAVSGTGDAQINLVLASGGATGTTGSLLFVNGAITTQAKFAAVASAASFPLFTPAVTGSDMQFSVGGTTSNLIIGTGAALATNATTGFMRISGMAGASVGTIANVSAGAPAIWIDTTNKKICYEAVGGTPECSAAFTP